VEIGMVRRVLLALAGLALSALPSAATPFWDLVAQIEYHEEERDGAWIVKKSFPEELVKQADGVTVVGYYVPIGAQAYVRSFVIVPTPEDCPFCGFGGYGIALEVQTRKPIPDIAEGTRIQLRGKLMLIESVDTYQSVILTDAALIE